MGSDHIYEDFFIIRENLMLKNTGDIIVKYGMYFLLALNQVK